MDTPSCSPELHKSVNTQSTGSGHNSDGRRIRTQWAPTPMPLHQMDEGYGSTAIRPPAAHSAIRPTSLTSSNDSGPRALTRFDSHRPTARVLNDLPLLLNPQRAHLQLTHTRASHTRALTAYAPTPFAIKRIALAISIDNDSRANAICHR